MSAGYRNMNAYAKTRAALAVAMTGLALGACSTGTTELENTTQAAALLSVQPVAGTTGVAVGTEVVVTFDHAMAEGMESYADLHEGSLTGPRVEGIWALSTDRTKLTFTPATALKAATTYVIHIGGGMMDAEGHEVDLGMHGTGMGGQWATESMMTGGMGGMMGGGTMGQHMGTGWENPVDGTYGMVFTFTTAG